MSDPAQSPLRVLVTRPQPAAQRTAAALAALGHAPVMVPLATVAATGAPLPSGPFGAVAATSANALAVADFAADVRALAFFAVGAATAAAARAAGFAHVRAAAGNAEDLARLIAAETQAGARVLYLAGAPRKPGLEAALADAGRVVVPVLMYRAVTLDPAAGLAAALAGGVDAALHYSQASARRFVALAGPAAPGRLRHLCLSADVARGLHPIDERKIVIAPQGNETALLALLEKCR